MLPIPFITFLQPFTQNSLENVKFAAYVLSHRLYVFSQVLFSLIALTLTLTLTLIFS